MVPEGIDNVKEEVDSDEWMTLRNSRQEEIGICCDRGDTKGQGRK